MFDESPPIKNTSEFPRNLEQMSVSDLEDYIKELDGEIDRVKSDIQKKKVSHDAANSIFK